jgi:hypothetical protein
MTKSQELKMALYDYLEGKPIVKLTKDELRILKSLDADKEVDEIIDERLKNELV